MTIISVITCILLLNLSCIAAQQKSSIYTQTFNSPTYDLTVRPNIQYNQPVVVDVNYRINLLYSVSAVNEMYSIDLYVRENWLDTRLLFNSSLWNVSIYGPLRIPGNKIWKPDTFFSNAITCATADELVTLTYSGMVRWARHMTCTFHADFNLIKFPFDTEIFKLDRLSFSYSSTELQLMYTPNLCFNPDPLQQWDNSLWLLTQTNCINSLYTFRVNQPDYSLVTAQLYIQRKSASYILKMILPMFVVVCLSTLTYWIDCTSPPARVGSTITLVLSIITFNLVVSSDLPKINYSTLLDWYVWKCFLFVLFAVAEFASINYILTSKIYSNKFALSIDDYCQWTILPVWLMSNLLFWPILNSAGTGCIATLEILYFIANMYRVYWNYHNDTYGMIIPVKRLLYNITVWYRNKFGTNDSRVIGLRHVDDPCIQ